METQPERLWREFIAAQNKALATLDIDDGFAAGRAWSAWLAEFVPDAEVRRRIHGSGR
jgi:hypothetical protein